MAAAPLAVIAVFCTPPPRTPFTDALFLLGAVMLKVHKKQELNLSNEEPLITHLSLIDACLVICGTFGDFV